jgi:8-oxo-dGTP pyrophosphatase MutT (NUDIX family)
MMSLTTIVRRRVVFFAAMFFLAVTSVSQAWISHPRQSTKKMQRMPSTLSISKESVSTESIDATLAGDFVVRMSREPEGSSERTVWSMYSIQDVVEDSKRKNSTTIWTDGTRAVESLKLLCDTNYSPSLDPRVVLSCFQHEQDHLELQCITESTKDDLALLLQLLQAQWVVCHQSQQTQAARKSWRISLDGHSEIFYGSMTEQHGLEQLFSDVLDLDASSTGEWVEMMTGSCQVIGRLPRSLVHKYNLLHRGIGVFVTKDRPIDLATPMSTENFPDVYVHQRVASKRIFPSLYDMFVGGVSTAGELSEVTAQREVAEELGLKQALLLPLSLWSDGSPILTCLVCTSYNRCLVDLYQYVMNTQRETISWQEEEVAWGEFVPYSVIAAAAYLSMERAAEERTWPGIYPPKQSDLFGKMREKEEMHGNEGWEKWDFVPDGLLVWTAWLEFVETRVGKEAMNTR